MSTTVFDTDRARILGTVLREMEQTLAPELTSPHARTMAHLLSHALRSLLVADVAAPALDTAWRDAASALLAQTGNAGPAQAAAIVALTDAPRRAMTPGAPLDATCRRALEIERDFFNARAAAVARLAPPERDAQQRELRALRPERLSAYFRQRLPGGADCEVTRVVPVLGGFSKETVLVEMTRDGAAFPVVIRRDIPTGALTTSVVDEFPLIASLHRAGLEVPEPLLLESDASVFGAPFTVTRRATGAAATNAMAGITANAEQVHAARELARFLARLHALELPALGLPATFFDPALSTRDYLHREIDICERYYRDHAVEPSPTIEIALAWLRANVPEVDAPPRLVHGDASLPNLMMDDTRISVMLDWELAHPGDYVEDLTYTRKWLDLFMPWEEFLACYHAAGGRAYHPERERFYAVLSDLRVGVFSVRARDMLRTCDHPELTHVFAEQHYYGYFITRVADALLQP